MPLQNTSGNNTTDAYGGGSVIPNYIEDVFSTYLYDGYGGTFSYNNGIDLSTKGGLVWIKSRTNVRSHKLTDTARGVQQALSTDVANAQVTDTAGLTAFLTNGFTLGAASSYNDTGSFASWTFRKQSKFFDVVTYTGTGSNRTIAHNLGSTPACIIVKRTNASSNWQVYHNGLTSAAYSIQLNSTAAQASATTVWNSTAPTSTVFSVGTDATVNASGSNYVAYIFASNAGGFGLTGADNVISCGSFTTDGSGNATVNLGYEPQFLIGKASSATGDWYMLDNMRGWPTDSSSAALWANLSSAEAVGGWKYFPTATGFNVVSYALSTTYIYIAIRRGPMKVPTDATKVFIPVIATPSGATPLTTNFPVDLTISDRLAGFNNYTIDRLRGDSQSYYNYLYTNSTNSETSSTGAGIGLDSNTTIVDNLWNTLIGVTTPVTWWNFKRAPSFFDEVCYIGNATTNTARSHNLAVIPEFMIFKSRDTTSNWIIYCAYLNGSSSQNNWNLRFSTAAQNNNSGIFGTQLPSASNFYTGGNIADINSSGINYVAYLFATCAGVSKVGTYTGNGTGQAIACGFTGGARFVLIKRIDATGNWYVFDSANGLTSGSSPYLLWNNGNAQVTGNNGVYASTGGFTLGATAVTTTNIATATYIFLAIA